MNSNERDSIIRSQNELYDELSRVLTDYEEDNCDTKDLYDMLVKIQNAWENTITCQIDTSAEQEQSFKLFNKYPSLKNFAKRMLEVTEDILSTAVEQSSENNRNYIAEFDKYNKPSEPIISPALIDDMLTDSGMVEDTILHDDCIELYLSEQALGTQFREHYDANWTTELEIICAKHALWIYGESGGERADFSNCLLENVNLSNCNLCGADFSGATFINCNLDDASMCDADFEDAKFKRCSLRHFTAEEADFKDSDFYNCDLRGACFTHSNFTRSKMADCNFHEVSFMNCCLESWTSTDCNLKIADMRNVSYDESEWFSEQDAGPSMNM